MHMESKTYLKNERISPKKVRFLVPSIKKMKPTQALDYLFYSPHHSAKILYKAIHSALSNAKQSFKVSEDLIKFKSLSIEEGQKMKRYKPGGRGTPKPIVRRFAHIRIILEAERPAVQKKSSKVSLKKT
ncbi:50S ribosomal protein L22 [Candidatus Roizmanbacteria bacterium CG09_land_8_20_14_0_10_41_9]|uniref:50S ribosomal protein L22 n=1 Tax=Candidatus Roizmanbacteria bacterium CG09_land_8_20_14_0_10_41_9 TaxID=1974850 RepID=A0A2H0WSW3_9BACT|nr:MAG: 50S ribosomal protein L22 [Candidatus Roizmanbacteria bacterium CG09_land_8_20_14_0_10_41_9]